MPDLYAKSIARNKYLWGVLRRHVRGQRFIKGIMRKQTITMENAARGETVNIEEEDEFVTWKCWCKIDSGFHLAWEYVYSTSVIYVAFIGAYHFGSWDMAIFVE